MHQLVDEDVLAHRRWHLDEPEVERDSACARARTPPRTLIPDDDAGDRHAMSLGQLEQLRNELGSRQRTKTALGGGPEVVWDRAELRALGAHHQPLPIAVPMNPQRDWL